MSRRSPPHRAPFVHGGPPPRTPPTGIRFVDSPTLIILAALLSGLVTVVLFAVWFFNHHIPGLRIWVLAFLSSSVFSASLLAGDWGA